MQLFLLLLAAIVIGYLIARSKWSKNIDDTSDKVKSSTTSTWNRLFSKKEKEEAPEETEEETASTEEE
jgi:hypothetical protein